SLSAFFFHRFPSHLCAHSFPTRRSSDLTLVPTSALSSVDLPALGAPTRATKPQRVSSRGGDSSETDPMSSSGSVMMPPTPSRARDRKSTRLNSSHVKISYAVFCLKKKRT